MVPEKMIDLHEGGLEVKIPMMDQPLIEDVSDREGVSRSLASQHRSRETWLTLPCPRCRRPSKMPQIPIRDCTQDRSHQRDHLAT